MNVVLFEPNAHGHRFTHLRRLVPTVAGLPGVKLTLVTSREALTTQEYAEQIKPLESMLTIEASKSYPIGEGNTYLKAAAAGAIWTAKHLRPDHLYVPYADGTIQIMGYRGWYGACRIPKGVELEGLMMRGEFAYPKRNDLRTRLKYAAWLSATASAPFSTIHHMDPIIAEALGRRRPSLKPKLRLIADPVEEFTPMTKEAARAALGVPTDGRYIGCVGYQDTRKGIDLLIHAFLKCRLRPGDRLLLAGGQEKEIKAVLAQGEPAKAVADGRIIQLARYISDQELMLAIAAMDVVATPYPPTRAHVGSSSIVIHAANQSKPVIGSNSGWVGITIRKFGLGMAMDVLDEAAFARGIEQSMEGAAHFTPSEGARRFVQFHRPDNFAAGFCKRLRERLGVPQPQGLREWSWVLEAAAKV